MINLKSKGQSSTDNYLKLIGIIDNPNVDIYGILSSSPSGKKIDKILGFHDGSNSFSIKFESDKETNISGSLPDDTLSYRRLLLNSVDFIQLIRNSNLLVSSKDKRKKTSTRFKNKHKMPFMVEVGTSEYPNLQYTLDKIHDNHSSEKTVVVIQEGIYTQDITLYPNIHLLSNKKVTLNGTIYLSGGDKVSTYDISGIDINCSDRNLFVNNSASIKRLSLSDVTISGSCPHGFITNINDVDEIDVINTKIENISAGPCLSIDKGFMRLHDVYLKTNGKTAIVLNGSANINAFYTISYNNWKFNDASTGTAINPIYWINEDLPAIIKNSSGALDLRYPIQVSLLKIKVSGDDLTNITGCLYDAV